MRSYCCPGHGCTAWHWRGRGWSIVIARHVWSCRSVAEGLSHAKRDDQRAQVLGLVAVSLLLATLVWLGLGAPGWLR